MKIFFGISLKDMKMIYILKGKSTTKFIIFSFTHMSIAKFDLCRSIMEMMRSLHENNIHSQDDAIEYIGTMFRPKFPELPEWKTNKEVCDYMMRLDVLLSNFVHFIVIC